MVEESGDLWAKELAVRVAAKLLVGLASVPILDLEGANFGLFAPKSFNVNVADGGIL